MGINVQHGLDIKFCDAMEWYTGQLPSMAYLNALKVVDTGT